jgi:hypothetical protein
MMNTKDLVGFAGVEALVPGAESTFSDLSDIDSEERQTIDEIAGQKETIRSRAPAHRNPTLIIGLGGTGLKTLDALKAKLAASSPKRRIPPGFAFLGFDCDQNEIAGLRALHAETEVYEITLKNPQAYYRANKSADFLDFVTQTSFPDNALYGAGQYRQVSRMCLMANFSTIRKAIADAVTPILPTARPGVLLHLDVFIVTSICGGAGSGMFIDIAALLKEHAEQNNQEVTIFGSLVTGDVYQKFSDIPERAHQRMLANTYACIKDLQYLQNEASEHNRNDCAPLILRYPNNHIIELSSRPYTLVMLNQGSNRFGIPTLISQGQLVHFLSNSLYLMAMTPLLEEHKSRWVNPNSGFAETRVVIAEGVPKSFSSVGYGKFAFPERELINYLNGMYGEVVLKCFLDFFDKDKMPAELVKDPSVISVQDYLSRLAQQEVDSGFEHEDLLRLFNESIRGFSFSQDSIRPAFLEVVNNEDWEKIWNSFEGVEQSLLKKVEELRTDVENAGKQAVRQFIDFLKELPEILVDRSVGSRHMLDFLNMISNDLEAEEHLTELAIEANEAGKTQNRREWNDQRKEIQAVLRDKPLFTFRGRARVKDKVDAYCKEFSEYLNNQLQELLLAEIRNTFRLFNAEINDSSQVTTRIISKFDAALQYYTNFRVNYQAELKSIAGRKGAYAKHAEFSILSLEQLFSFKDQVLKKKPPRRTMLELFGRRSGTTSGDQRAFWDYRNPRITALTIVTEIQKILKPLFTPYRMSLKMLANQLNLDDQDVLNEVKAAQNACSAQWLLLDTKKGMVEPVIERTIAYPENYMPGGRAEDAPPSTSDRVIEMLAIEYAMPAQLLAQISNWKKIYDAEDQLNNKDGGLHNILQSAEWDDVDRFPGKEETLRLFALGLAFGYVYNMTELEKSNIKLKYKTDYRNFIFARGNNYYLMPYYSIEAKRSEMKKKIHSLGNGRETAFETFRQTPEFSNVVKEWIDSRIQGKDVEEVISLLNEYIDGPLDDLATSDQVSLARQAKKEQQVLKTYIKGVQRNKTFSLE